MPHGGQVSSVLERRPVCALSQAEHMTEPQIGSDTQGFREAAAQSPIG